MGSSRVGKAVSVGTGERSRANGPVVEVIEGVSVAAGMGGVVEPEASIVGVARRAGDND